MVNKHAMWFIKTLPKNYYYSFSFFKCWLGVETAEQTPYFPHFSQLFMTNSLPRHQETKTSNHHIKTNERVFSVTFSEIQMPVCRIFNVF